MYRLWMILAGLTGFLAVGLSAFGAHMLADVLPPDELSNFELAGQFQFYHALALLAVGWLASKSAPFANFAGSFFVIGVICFSGSLYLIGFTDLPVITMITPFGGVALMLGWALIILGAVQEQQITPAA